MKDCILINDKTFTKGGFDNVYYTQRIVKSFLDAYYQNNTNIFDSESFFTSQIY
jgi:hypothetical protein